MSAIIWDPVKWAEREFGECQLGDARRVKRLMQLAVQVAARPDGSTPDQCEEWPDLKAAYRLFAMDDVTFQAIIEPHTRHTREGCRPGDVMLILNDTTELDFSTHRKTEGIGPIGNGGGRGFFLHSGLMVNAKDGRVEGMAGQEIFYRKKRRGRKRAKDSTRRSADRESAVWGKLIDRIGAPPPGVTWIHVDDRGADDLEVMWKSVVNGCGFVIRGARLNRNILTRDGRTLPLAAWLDELPTHGQRKVRVAATPKKPARTATVELRYGEVLLPRPQVITPWLRQHAPNEPLKVSVVELREVNPPKNEKAIRWVLYSTEPATTREEANQIIQYYEKRWTIEEYHKAYKTGCRVESRQYRTAERLERVAGLLSVCAVRLMQLKTAAKETPDRPAEEVAPKSWVKLLIRVRGLPESQPLTIREFVRELAGLGGFLKRKCDGEPGWITLWRGFEKLQLILRGADAVNKKCG